MVVVEKRKKLYIFDPFKCRVAELERILNPRHTTDLPTPFTSSIDGDSPTEEVTELRLHHHHVSLYVFQKTLI